jgi:hypothetical protein
LAPSEKHPKAGRVEMSIPADAVVPDEAAEPLEPPPPHPIKDKRPSADKTIKREFIKYFSMGFYGQSGIKSPVRQAQSFG